MRIYLLGAAFFFCTGVSAQVNIADSAASATIFNISGAYIFKGGDFAEYFANSAAVGGDVQYKFRSHWMISAGARFHFSDRIRQETEIFGGMITETGFILNLNGEYANISFRENGYEITADVSRVFPQWGHNANSGPIISAGVGYVTHYIFIRSNEDNVPNLSDEYAKGYDRLHRGLLTRQFIGYFHAGSNKRLNFTVGFEFMQGFTQNVRKFNYDTRQPDTGSKLDLYYGLKLSWFLPLYSSNTQQYYYN